jgi:hypothetical protein
MVKVSTMMIWRSTALADMCSYKKLNEEQAEWLEKHFV